MTNETLHDGDFELRPADAPREWLAFKREARYQARIRQGHPASIELFPAPSGGRCDGLTVDEEDEDTCDDRAIAVVTDEHEIDGTRHLCEVHLSMYLSDVLPLLNAWETAFRENA